MRACIHKKVQDVKGGEGEGGEEDGGERRHEDATAEDALPPRSVSLFLLEQCKARVNGANMRGGQAGVTALSQVKSRLTPLITQI